MIYLTAKDIKAAIRRHYSKQGCAVAFEVAHGTGRHANRHVDAVVFDLWPSRGLTLHAIEVKVSRSDLKRELAQGAKGEEVAQHCDLFSIAAPLGIVKANELPEAWGLIEVTKDTLLKHTKAPARTKAAKVDREFMAAMVRAVAKGPEADIEAERRAYRLELNTNQEKRVRERADAMQPKGALWDKLMDEVKGDGKEWVWDDEVRAAVRYVMRSGVLKAREGLVELEGKMKAMTEALSTARKGAEL